MARLEATDPALSPAAPPASPRPPEPLLLLTALLAAVTALYLPSLDGAFVWDDHALIVDNPSLRSLGAALRAFGTGFWPDAELGLDANDGYFRPLTLLSYALDLQVWGERPFGLRLTNLALHVGSMGLVYALGRRYARSSGAGLGAALLWGLAPRSAEVVAWVSARADALATLCGLAALLVWPSPASQQPCPGAAATTNAAKLSRRLGAAGLIVLGLLAKESALAVAVGIVVMHAAQARSEPLARRLRATWPVWVAVSSYAALRVLAVGARLGAGGAETASRRVLLALEAVGRYTLMLLDPWQPRLQIGALATRHTGFVALGALALVAGVAACRRARRSLSPAEWGLVAVAGVSLGLVCHLVPLHTSVVAADRYLYLPMAALVLLLARPALALTERWRRHVLRSVPPGSPSRGARGVAALPAVALLGLALSLAPVTRARAMLWASEPAFWREMLETTPGRGCRPLSEMGAMLQSNARPAAALSLYAAVEARGCSYARQPALLLDRALADLALGRYDAGSAALENLTARRPGGALPLRWLARAALMRFDFAAAEQALARLAQRAPDDAELAAWAARTRALRAEHGALQRGGALPPTALTALSPLLLQRRCALEHAAGRSLESLACWETMARSPGTPTEARIEAAGRVVGAAPPPVVEALLAALERDPALAPVTRPLGVLYRSRLEAEAPFDGLIAWLRVRPDLAAFFGHNERRP